MANTDRPAILGGSPRFGVKLPITRPTLPPAKELLPDLERVLTSCMITNSESVDRFERAVAEYLGVSYVIAVSSCTSGLLLVLRALGLEREVVLPSFTFSATGHAGLWNRLQLRFVDIEPTTFNVDVRAVEKAITPRTEAVIGVHIFGNPCDTEELEDLATRHSLRLVFDSAHALGSISRGKKVGGFGDAEVFSLSPTKLVVAGEGGMVATNDATLARLVKVGRDYGNLGNQDCEYAGLSARMGEFNALLGIRSFAQLETNVGRRNRLAEDYQKHLVYTPGISFQEIRYDCRSTYKDFAIVIDADTFGLTRDELVRALNFENIEVRKYFDPPLHRQRAYRQVGCDADGLANTEKVAQSTLCLPMFSHMEEGAVEKVCEAILQIHEYSSEVALEVRRADE